MIGRILAVDPGERRLGIAVSDPTGTISRPLTVLVHQSRLEDARRILELAAFHDVQGILVGKPFQDSGIDSPQGRKAERLVIVLRTEGTLPVTLWDESGTTDQAQSVRLEMGVSRVKRAGHLDSLAAAIMLQDYLDTVNSDNLNEETFS